MTQVDEILTDAIAITGECARHAADRFSGDHEVRLKADGTEATPADVEVERLFRRLIAQRYPSDVVVGEEEGGDGDGARRWTIDPINGTSLFVRHIPTFTMLLSVADDTGPLVSVIAYPVTGELYYAARARGSWHQLPRRTPRQVMVSDRTELSGATVSSLNIHTWPEELLVALHREVVLLSHFKGAAGVAEGMTDGFVIAGFPMGEHDLAPMPLMIGEAGGRVTTLDGDPVVGGDGSMIASNGHLHDQLLDLVRSTRTTPHV